MEIAPLVVVPGGTRTLALASCGPTSENSGLATVGIHAAATLDSGAIMPLLHVGCRCLRRAGIPGRVHGKVPVRPRFPLLELIPPRNGRAPAIDERSFRDFPRFLGWQIFLTHNPLDEVAFDE